MAERHELLPSQQAPGRLEDQLQEQHPHLDMTFGEVRAFLDYDELLNCMRCGFCLPACPTYREVEKESATPRGRIALMKGIADGLIRPEEFEEQAYVCLGCRACETACPAGVKYGHLIEGGRALLEAANPPKGKERFVRRLFFKGIFPHPRRLKVLGAALWLYQKSGLRWVAHQTGLARAVAGSLADMDAALPTLPTVRHRFRPAPPATGGKKQLRVGMFTGCVMDVMFGPVNDATARVLEAAGCEIVIPASGRGAGEQVCCGALHAHAGEPGDAKELAKRNIAAFEAANVDVIMNNAGGCGAALKEYHHWFHDDPDWRERAEKFVAKMKDFSELLATLPLPEGMRHTAERVTYQDSCHLRHGQGVISQPRKLMRSIPGVEFCEMHESDRCCGSAGIYNLTQPELSMQILDKKMEHATATEATTIVTSNPGCLLQMRLGIQRAGLQDRVRAVHIAELLAEALPKS